MLEKAGASQTDLIKLKNSIGVKNTYINLISSTSEQPVREILRVSSPLPTSFLTRNAPLLNVVLHIAP